MQEEIISEAGSMLCESKYCKYRSSCANHSSAGDFRTEGGFSPKLVFGDNKNQIICLSSNIECNNSEHDAIPINHYDQGYANAIERSLIDLERISCDNCNNERGFQEEFEILFDKESKKFFKKCLNCRLIDEIKI